MGTDEGYRLRLDRFGVRYKRGKGSKEFRIINWISVFLFCSILSVYLFFEDSSFYVIFWKIILIFLMLLAIEVINFKFMKKMKKDIHLKKEIYIKFEDKDIYFYNVRDPEKRMGFRHGNNDFLYKKRIFGGLALVVNGTIKEYCFYISKNNKNSDYDRFYNDLQKNYIEKIKFWTWKKIFEIFIFLYLGIMWLIQSR